MKDHIQTYIQYRIQRAKDSLIEAEVMFDIDHIPACVSRQYYACFYAVSALLLCKGFKPSKHTHVRSLLHRELVKEGLIDVVHGTHFDILFNNRKRADYADLPEFQKEQVAEWLDKTRCFVSCLDSLVADCVAERNPEA